MPLKTCAHISPGLSFNLTPGSQNLSHRYRPGKVCVMRVSAWLDFTVKYGAQIRSLLWITAPLIPMVSQRYGMLECWDLLLVCWKLIWISEIRVIIDFVGVFTSESLYEIQRFISSNQTQPQDLWDKSNTSENACGEGLCAAIQCVVLKIWATAWLKFKGKVYTFAETAFTVNTAYSGSIRNYLNISITL